MSGVPDDLFDDELSSKDGGILVPRPEEPFEYQWFDEEHTQQGLVAQSAIVLMDTGTTMLNRVIRWLEKP